MSFSQTPSFDEIVGTGKDPIKVNPLEQQEYVTVGQTKVVLADPGIVHFSGFQINKEHHQIVRVVNTSAQSTRLHIFYPYSAHFKAYCNKKGTIMPGMSEDIHISFTPTAYQYYYDCIKINNEGGNLLIPIHAYPVINKLDFPRTIDFGGQPLGEIARRSIHLKCSVPIQFEYKITTTKSHSDFSVYPSRGIIPANDNATLTVKFQPTRMVNCSAEIQLEVSQIGFKPMKCSITGFSSPDLEQKARRNKKVSKKRSDPEIMYVNQEEVNQPELANDELSTKQSVAHSSGQTTKSTRKKTVVKVIEVEEKMVEGLKIPKSLDGVNATTFVLTQQPGKLKPKDLKKAIDEQRRLRKKQKEEQEALRQKTGAAGGQISANAIIIEESPATEQTSRQLKELAFLQDLQEIDKKEKDLEFQSQKDHLGEPLMKDEDVRFINRVREYNQMVKERDERQLDRERFESTAYGLLSTPSSRSSLMLGYVPQYKADFNPYKNNDWAKRKRTTRRFKQAVSRLIIRLRADKRIGLIKKRLGNAKTRMEVRQLVELDWKFGSTAGNETQFDQYSVENISPDIERVSFPLYIESEEKARQAEETQTPRSFQDFHLFRLKAPDEAELMGYHEHALPVVSYNIPLERGRLYREGAQYEEGTRAPRSSVSEESQVLKELELPPLELSSASIRLTAMENKCPIDPLTLLKPTSGLRVFTPIHSCREADPEYEVRPRIWQREIPLTNAVALNNTIGTMSVRSILCHETLSSRWRTSQVHPFSTVCNDKDIPQMLTGPSKEDELSESESDNEDENMIKIPTIEQVKYLFLSRPTPEEEENQQDETTSAPEERLFDYRDPLTSFDRYLHQMDLEKEYNSTRSKAREMLPERLKKMTSFIELDKNQFILEGHGPTLPRHLSS